MKIRTDFVTNSSSSGFVAITVDIKNGETGKFNDGHKIVDVIYYPLGEYTDEKPSRVAANKAAENANNTE